ncbi:TRAP transporter small permease [uncultured Mailhella sp.]|uniref:TRAP transporter small permease n=1 Tax=uncultured Mailhella sp. TaxID=1981031 RepID=UPI00263546EA|nr:TRAP transporter small permease [uncultured Mailhella sp.]
MSESIKNRNKANQAGALACQMFCACIFLGMIGLVFLNAFLRYCFNSGYPPSEEWARFLFIYITFFGAIEAFYRKKHIAVEMVVDLLQGNCRKAMNIIAILFSLGALGVLLQGGIIYVLQTLDTYAIATYVNMAIINIMLPIMAAAAIVLQLRDLIAIIRTPASEFKKVSGMERALSSEENELDAAKASASEPRNLSGTDPAEPQH